MKRAYPHRSNDEPLASLEPVELPPRVRLRRPYLYQIEFHDRGVAAELDDLLGDVPAPSARTPDPRVRELVRAAAEGWVIERY